MNPESLAPKPILSTTSIWFQQLKAKEKSVNSLKQNDFHNMINKQSNFTYVMSFLKEKVQRW